MGMVFSLSILFFYKYLDFFWLNLSKALKVEINGAISWDIVLPVGISFYIFQSLGYVIDVYREDIEAEKNFLKYAAFVSFFPVILSGPIERAKNLLKQINEPVAFEVANVRNGLLTFAWGLFLKLVVADRIALFINPMFTEYSQYDGMTLLVAIMLYGFQIYCDFWGYSKMAEGTAWMLGYRLRMNFDSPYYALSVQEFWRRWHISLTSWFRDYLYIPLGGNRKGKIRKHINTMIVFLTSGLWHGAGWKYIIWGGLNGAYIVLQEMTCGVRNMVYKKLKIRTDTCAFKWISRIVTFILIDAAWLFFRANSMGDALGICRIIANDFRVEAVFSEVFWEMFISVYDFVVIFVPLGITLYVDYLNYKAINVRDKILNQHLVVRWSIYFVIIIGLLFLGVYGGGYEQTQFIYFQF